LLKHHHSKGVSKPAQLALHHHGSAIQLFICVAGGAKGTNASQFYITTGQELDSLDGKHTIFGEVSEGLDVLQQIDEAFVDDAGRPLQNIRSAFGRLRLPFAFL